MRTIGVMRVCDEFVEEIELSIGWLAARCDAVCFLTNNVTNERIIAAMDDCDYMEAQAEYVGDSWNHYYSLDQAYRLANRFGPEWIVMQDQDELLPIQINDALEEMDDDGTDTLVIPVLHCWESPNWVVDPAMNQTGNHAKAYRGGNDHFTICHGGGFCLPGCEYRAFHWPYAYRHLGFMTKTCREVRRTVDGIRTQREVWEAEEFKTYPYRHDWPIDRYAALSERTHIDYGHGARGNNVSDDGVDQVGA